MSIEHIAIIIVVMVIAAGCLASEASDHDSDEVQP